jgi:flagellar biosynthetic protein FliO
VTDVSVLGVVTDASVLGLLARLVVSLAVVLGLMLGAAWVLRRRGGGFTRPSGVTEVIARQSLSRTASLQVVRVGERTLVLGVTEQSVSYLTEADGDELRPTIDVRAGARRDGSGAEWTMPPGSENERSGSTRTSFLDVLRDRTTRG